jgi:hypothetical protein
MLFRGVIKHNWTKLLANTQTLSNVQYNHLLKKIYILYIYNLYTSGILSESFVTVRLSNDLHNCVCKQTGTTKNYIKKQSRSIPRHDDSLGFTEQHVSCYVQSSTALLPL